MESGAVAQSTPVVLPRSYTLPKEVESDKLSSARKIAEQIQLAKKQASKAEEEESAETSAQKATSMIMKGVPDLDPEFSVIFIQRCSSLQAFIPLIQA